MRYILFALFVFFAIGCQQLQNPQPQQDSQQPQQPQQPPQQADPNQYLYVQPQSQYYYKLPPGHPPGYYSAPQYYFYSQPPAPYYRPGISISVGSGWWYTPGYGLINIGYYHPTNRPYPGNGPHHGVHRH